jgi:AcrR family transcriptional regulator
MSHSDPKVATTSGTRREREREEMKRLITGAARKLFVSEGYESTTIRRIAEAIEYTPGAIYSYFKDKDAILYALHQEGFLELQRRFFSAITPGKNPVEQLAELGEAYVAFAHQNPEMYHLMFVAQATSRTLHEADAWPEGKTAYESLRSLVQLAVDGGWIRPGDPEIVAFALWATAHGSVTLEICDRCMVLPEAHRANISRSAFSYLLSSLVAGKPPQAATDDALGGASSQPVTASTTPEPRRRRSMPES